MEKMKPFQIIYSSGTFGNCVRWMFDRFSTGTKFNNINSPWDADGRAHGFSNDKFMLKFSRAHQINDKNTLKIDKNALKIVINYDLTDLVFVERCSFYRNPGNDDNTDRYKNIIQEANKSFVDQTFRNSSSRNVAKELKKIQFHDIANHAWWNGMKRFMEDRNNYQFSLYSLFNTNDLVKEFESASYKLGLNLKIDTDVITNVVEKVKKTFVVQTKDRVKHALDAIMTNNYFDCADFDIIEQAFIESELEKINDGVLFPFGVNWFENTTKIIEFLETYPTYLKHMNPRLPWYNNVRNPFYLTGKIDKST